MKKKKVKKEKKWVMSSMMVNLGLNWLWRFVVTVVTVLNTYTTLCFLSVSQSTQQARPSHKARFPAHKLRDYSREGRWGH